MISINQLQKSVNDFLLQMDDHTFHTGLTIIVGKNGAGKSTFLHLMATVLQPDKGTIRYANLPQHQLPVIRSHIGFLPTGLELYPAMRVETVLRYLADLKGKDKKNALKNVGEVMQVFHLDKVKKTKVKHLSHGYRQRLGIAQAVMGWPSFLFMDEPFTSLDVHEKSVLVSLLHRQYRGRRTAFIVSHDLSEWEDCDHVLWIDDGRIRFYGSLSQWKHSYPLQVWEGPMETHQLSSIPEERLTLKKMEGNQLKVRMIVDHCPGLGFEVKEPTMEEAYIIRQLI